MLNEQLVSAAVDEVIGISLITALRFAGTVPKFEPVMVRVFPEAVAAVIRGATNVVVSVWPVMLVPSLTEKDIEPS
jgi:hypothetical protein